MSVQVRSRDDLKLYIRLQQQSGVDPWLSISEVSVVTRFHRRTLQRYVDEGIIRHERRGPKRRVYIPWSVVKAEFRQDTLDI